MRVAIFTESYEPIVNGVSVVAATLRDGLRARGHEVFIFAPHFPGCKDTEGVFRLPSRMSRLAPGYPIPFPYAPKIRAAFCDLRPNIVHTQTPFLLGITGLSWARRAQVPVVSTNHTLYTEYVHYAPFIPKTLARAFLVHLMKWYYSRCDAVAVPSQPVEKILRGYGVRVPIEVIKSGVTVNAENNRLEFREAFGIPAEAFLLLYVGRVAREKNLQLLLRAFKTIRSRHVSSKLLIVGSGPDVESCRAEAKALGFEDSIAFAGMLSRQEVAKSYAAADAFVFPSVTETQGLVICEALTAGLPCVAVRAAGVPEVIEDRVDGLLTENTVESFAESTCRLISDPEFRNRLAEGALRNSKKFSVGAMIERFEAFYRSAIEQAGKTG